jgi:hypothetical protein
VEYLQKSFADRYGSPSDALASLPSTARWISSLKDVVEEQWNEHVSSLSILPEADHVSASFGLVFFFFSRRRAVHHCIQKQMHIDTNTWTQISYLVSYTPHPNSEQPMRALKINQSSTMVRNAKPLAPINHHL